MKSWNTTLLVCDDVMYSITGKVSVFGVYTGDIGIPNDAHLAPQLIFFFVIDGDLSERPILPLKLEIKLPEEDARSVMISPPILPNPAPEGRTKWYMRHPFLVSSAILRPGRIEAKIVYDGEDISLSAPWISRTIAS
ncbi:MAG: hypothetical protein NTV97_04615 [Alphaproteobacteria bacterium]|nr:hypothetical protein [Alphaproteobacteria bacterium]